MITCILHNYNWLLEDAHQFFTHDFNVIDISISIKRIHILMYDCIQLLAHD